MKSQYRYFKVNPFDGFDITWLYRWDKHDDRLQTLKPNGWKWTGYMFSNLKDSTWDFIEIDEKEAFTLAL